MNKLSKIYTNKIIILFIIMQPIIDVITYFMKENYGSILTFGIIIRTLFFAYTLVYLIFIDRKNKKHNLIYIAALFIIFIINILVNLPVNNISYWFVEIKNIIKIGYLPLTLIFFNRYNKNNETNKLPFDFILINIITISAILLISKFTGTQVCTYGHTIGCINGNSGWFYSANELSMILVLLFPFALHKFIHSKYSFLGIFATIMAIYSMIDIGTKAAYMGLIGILVAYILILIVMCFKNFTLEKLKNVIMIGTLILMVYILTPASPVCFNNFNLFRENKIYCQVPLGEENELTLDQLKKKYTRSIVIDTIENQIFKGREIYLKEYKELYTDTNILQRLFGIGYFKDNESNENLPYVIEMDFYDLIFKFGYVGFVVILFPIGLYMFNIIKIIIKHPKEIFKEEWIIMGGVVICLFGSIISGHVLFAPAVTTYLSYILSNKTWNK